MAEYHLISLDTKQGIIWQSTYNLISLDTKQGLIGQSNQPG